MMHIPFSRVLPAVTTATTTLLLLAVPPTAAQAQSASAPWPQRPVTLMVGYPAGGAIDQSARAVGQALATRWGQSVIVENRAGANGTIASAAVAQAKPDGYTLLVTATSHTLNKFVVKGLRYDVDKSFAPIALTVDVPNVLVVPASAPWQTVAQLVAAMKAKQKPFNYASQGIGGIPHLAGEIFKLRTGTEMVHVPYKGAAPGMTDLAAGIVDMSFPSPASALSFIAGGKLRALAVSAPQRFAQLPNVPTFAEAGIPDFVLGTWHGLLAPAGTPPAVIAKINGDVNEIIQTADFKATLAAQGNIAAQPLTPAQFATKLQTELKAFEAVASKVDLAGS